LATCWLNEISKSIIGHIILDSGSVNQFRNVKTGSFDTSTLAQHISLFEKKLGSKK